MPRCHTGNTGRTVAAQPEGGTAECPRGGNTAIHLVLRQQSAAELISLRTEKQTQVENLGKQCDLLFLEMREKKEVIETV